MSNTTLSHDDPFYSAKLKIERAEHHIADLENAFESWLQLNGDGFSVSTDGQSTTIKPSQDLPITLSLIIADALHNLRVALDHANWELRGLDGGEQGIHTKLPVRESKAKFEAVCKGIKTPTGDLPKFFLDFEFYPGGRGALIWLLHDLDNMDKHQILPTTAQQTSLPPMTIVGEQGGVIDIMGGGFSFIGGEGSSMFRLGGNYTIQQHTNAKPPVDIVFGNVDGFEFKPVIPTLVHLTDAVKQMLRQCEMLVQSRT